MTKLDAIKKVMEENKGTASLNYIYENIEKYYPSVKVQKDWQAGIRGVLYRELYKDNSILKKIGLNLYALADYKQDSIPANDKVRMHSYIEGICVELGNFNDYATYTADASVLYRDNIRLQDIIVFKDLPHFSYPEVMTEVKKIDVIWLNKKGLSFPRKVFEIVDSIGTLNGAFNRICQLLAFNTDFYIVAPEKHRGKYEQTIQLGLFNSTRNRFKFINYEKIIDLYNTTLDKLRIENSIF